MKRLTQKQIKNRIAEYSTYYDGETMYKDIAIDLAKDFIYNAQLEFEKYLNAHYQKLGGKPFDDKERIREVAINETSQYLEDARKPIPYF